MLASHCNQQLSTQSSHLQVPAQISPYHGRGTTVTLLAPQEQTLGLETDSAFTTFF
jgi:hypothetical protein